MIHTCGKGVGQGLQSGVNIKVHPCGERGIARSFYREDYVSRWPIGGRHCGLKRVRSVCPHLHPPSTGMFPQGEEGVRGEGGGGGGGGTGGVGGMGGVVSAGLRGGERSWFVAGVERRVDKGRRHRGGLHGGMSGWLSRRLA